jgi:hypothetical protein
MRDVGIGPCTSSYHYGQKNPEIIKVKKNEDHNFTSSVCFHSTPSKTQRNNQKAYLLSLGRPNLFEDQKPPQNPI